ncbi:MAG: flagellar basal-body MS-ring/collar protein FliF [Clostridia bacterium]
MAVSSPLSRPSAPWSPYLKSFQAWWRRAPHDQRRRQAFAAGVGVVLTVGLGIWVLTPRWTALYTGLSPSAAGAMTSVLQQVKIPYRLAAGGGTILVPSSEVDQGRVDLAQHNLPTSGSATLPSQSSVLSLGQTPAQTAAAEQAALEAELDQTLTGIAGVSRAQVLITEPPTALFGESATPASASVFLQLNLGSTLSAAQVGAVQHLVASAVSGLQPDHVSVVNQEGQLLSSAPNVPAGLDQGQWQRIEAINSYYENRVTTLLDQIFGPGSSVVRVSSQVNWQAVTTQITKVSPSGLSAKQTQNSTGTNPTGTASGTATNTPTYTTGTTGGGTTSSQSTISRYVTSTTKTSGTTPAGQLTHLTVAVAINRHLTASQKASVTALVRQAVGATKGDALTVVGLPFDTAAAQAAAAAMTRAASRQQALHYGRDILAVLVILGLLLWIRRQFKAQRPEAAPPTADVVPGILGPVTPASSPVAQTPTWAQDPAALARVLAELVVEGDEGHVDTESAY